jgi:sigma-E factor negative regulatory protein RseC
MIETPALVMRAEGQTAWVETRMEGACGSCGSGGCDVAILSNLFHRRPREYRVHNGIGARVGDRVMVGLREGALLRSTAAIYGLPLLLLLAGAMLGGWLAPEAGVRDDYSVVGALAALMAGGAWIAWFAGKSRRDDRYQPVILRRTESNLVLVE